MILRGVVIKKSDKDEYDQLVTFYTRETGKITGIAKSSKKATSKQASHLEVFNLTDFLLVGGNGYPIIASAQSLHTFPAIKESLSKSAHGFFILELFNYLVYDQDPDSQLWQALLGFLTELNDQEKESSEWRVWLADQQKNILKTMGYHHLNDQKIENFFQYLGQRSFSSLEFLNIFNGARKS